MRNNLSHFTDAVKQFHKIFKAPFAETVQSSIPEDRAKLRHELMREENNEYLEAALDGNKIEVADALGDMLYILCGTIIEHGMQHKIEDVFNEIQASNMSKLDSNGKPILREDGKILKSDTYFKPDLVRVMNVISDTIILENVISFIDESLAERLEDINQDTILSTLGIDSLDLIDICMDIEKAYDIVIQDSELETVKTAKDLVDTIKKHL